jgi:site-specific DNA-methyltransferase (adenine-specific)
MGNSGLKADDMRALIAVAQREKATSLGFGIFVTLNEPTPGMRADAASAGTVTINGKSYALIQILTVKEMLKGTRPRLPLVDASAVYKKGARADAAEQESLL